MSQVWKITYVIGLLALFIIGMYFMFRRKETFQNMLNEVQQSIPPLSESLSSSQPSNIVIPEVSVSGSAYDAMSLQQKSKILRDIQNAVKNEILSQRQIQPITPKEQMSKQLEKVQEQTEQNIPSNSIQQGKEYNSCKSCPSNPDGSCPPVPDMSQYIRKDQIPCWNCTLDY